MADKGTVASKLPRVIAVAVVLIADGLDKESTKVPVVVLLDTSVNEGRRFWTRRR